MHRVRAVALVAAFAPAMVVVACVGDDSSEGPADAGGSAGTSIITGGSGSKGGMGGTGGTGGSSGSGGSAGAAIDAGTGGNAGSGGGGGTGGNAGSAGTSGTGGAAGASIDSGRDGVIVTDATPDRMDGARPDAAPDASTPDGGAACMSGPAMGMTCTTYCSAWFSTCQPMAMWSSTYATPAACMSACATWDDAKLCCRAEQVHDAVVATNPNQADKSCGHAAGVNGPAACN